MPGHTGRNSPRATIQVVHKNIQIHAPLDRVWEILTVPELIKQWMYPTELDIVTNWQVGSPFLVRGVLHGIPFENKGTVLQFEPRNVLQ